MIKVDDIAQMPTLSSHGNPWRGAFMSIKKLLANPLHETLTLGSGKSRINQCKLWVLFLRLGIHFWKAACYIFPFSTRYLPPLAPLWTGAF